ncbi:MAG: hypothetical protein IT317_24800 [Anaerolineales bacterium]|nr:hypothetical protein [Anaerolineales bacterium]
MPETTMQAQQEFAAAVAQLPRAVCSCGFGCCSLVFVVPLLFVALSLNSPKSTPTREAPRPPTAQERQALADTVVRLNASYAREGLNAAVSAVPRTTDKGVVVVVQVPAPMDRPDALEVALGVVQVLESNSGLTVVHCTVRTPAGQVLLNGPPTASGRWM